MGEGYGTLRLWSTVLVFVGVLGVIFVVIGKIFAGFAAPTFWQGLRALADVAEYSRRQESGLG